MLRTINRFVWRLSKNKAPSSSADQILKISKLKLDESIGGYRIYFMDQKQNSFFYTSIGLTIGACASAFVVYVAPTFGNIVAFMAVLAAFISYQRRLKNTLRELIVDKLG